MDNFDAFEVMKKIEEERKLQQEELEIRYQERRTQKLKQRGQIEAAAMKICERVHAELDADTERRPEDITALAAALNHAAMTMDAAERYAEFRPIYGAGLGGFSVV